jgi:D-beta-D-heptose 7-phosphate kinase/D-beta-D-heptose 1-phosphate adenosyltransferase
MITQPLKKFKILLIGDDCVDIYRYGTVNRLCPEAPVPIFEPSHDETRPGMANNVAQNFLSLGCEVTTMLGDASTKIRLIDIRSGQQVLRLDQNVQSSPIKLHCRIPQTFDAVVISDYNKGAVDHRLIREIRKEFVGPVFIDTKKSELAKFNGCILKINEREFNDRKSICDQLIVTLGDRGARYHDHGTITDFAPHRVEVSDVCGAGDTFLAALVYQYLVTGEIAQAIEFAMSAAAVTVQHLGVYAPTLEEINAISW